MQTAVIKNSIIAVFCYKRINKKDLTSPWWKLDLVMHSTGFEPAAFRSGAERSIP